MNRRRVMLVAVVAWALVLAGGAIWSVRHGRATAREQTTIAAAQSTVDAAVGEVDASAAGTGTVVAIGPYQKVGDCKVTAVRSGARYQRIAVAYTAVGTEEDLLGRVAARLPTAYGARMSRGAAPRLTADAGDFVALSGGIAEPGEVRFVADTGCRPVGSPVGGPIDASEPASTGAAGPVSAGADPAPVEAVLARLGARASEWRTHRVPCPGGGPLWTVEAVADGVPPGSLDGFLRGSVGDAAVVATPDVYAFRSGPVGITVRTDSGRLVVTATTDCQ